MNSENTYGNLKQALGDEIRFYTTLEHGRGRGNGTAVLEPHMGGYNDYYIENLSDFALEAVETAYELFQGVDQYDVEANGDLTAEEAIEEILNHQLPDNPGRELTPTE